MNIINDSTKMLKRSHARGIHASSCILLLHLVSFPPGFFNFHQYQGSLPPEAAEDTVLDRDKPDGLITSDSAANGNLRGWKQFDLKTRRQTNIVIFNRYLTYLQVVDLSLTLNFTTQGSYIIKLFFCQGKLELHPLPHYFVKFQHGMPTS